jgi:hypothetical protein
VACSLLAFARKNLVQKGWAVSANTANDILRGQRRTRRAVG